MAKTTALAVGVPIPVIIRVMARLRALTDFRVGLAQLQAPSVTRRSLNHVCGKTALFAELPL